MFAIIAIMINVILIVGMNDPTELKLSAVFLEVGFVGFCLAFQMLFNHTEIKSKLNSIERRLNK